MRAVPSSKWSWKLGRIFGIDLFVHATFFVLLPWIALAYYWEDRTVLSAARGVVFILVVFAVVVMHELSHALMARRFGIRTKDITLLPIGGVARLERMPEKPSEELLVALAGPASNLLLAAVLFGLLSATHHSVLVSGTSPSHAPFLTKLLWVNVSLFLFNMLPAFPMDGGRVLRALLAMRMDYVRATRAAAALGRGIALFLGLIGLFFAAPMLVLIAVFVWIGAGAERAGLEVNVALAGQPIRAAMITEFRTLSPTDSLTTAVDRLLSGSQHDFPVVDADKLVGVLTRTDLIRSLAQSPRHAATLVGEVMSRNFLIADPSDTLLLALERLKECDCPTLPVVRGGLVIGLLTMENIGELLMVRGALADRPGAPVAVVAVPAVPARASAQESTPVELTTES
jgi:Zn-dependent protease/predicted transcriptional regulator